MNRSLTDMSFRVLQPACTSTVTAIPTTAVPATIILDTHCMTKFSTYRLMPPMTYTTSHATTPPHLTTFLSQVQSSLAWE